MAEKKVPLYQEGLMELTPEMVKKIEEEEKKKKELLKKSLGDKK